MHLLIPLQSSEATRVEVGSIVDLYIGHGTVIVKQ